MNRWRPMLANGAVITVVSLLLWLWAAGQTRETSTVEALVRFLPADAERSIVTPADAIPVSVELQGSRHELERATDRLSGKTLALRTGRPEVPASAGVHTIDITAALNRSEEFNSVGVAAISSVPASMSIEIMETVTVDAKVVPMLPGAQLNGTPIVSPETVKVTLPKALLPGLGADASIEAFLPAAQTNTLETGRRHLIDVPLRVPEALAERSQLVRFASDRAKVIFTLQSRSSSTVLRLVPVQLAGPPLDLEGYRITLDPGSEFLRDVAVTGPAATILALEDGRLKALAFVHLTADDLARRTTRKRIEMWMLPPGVSVQRIGDSGDLSPEVSLTVAERRETPG
ncbi:MAG: hypothetical protein JNL80_16890 [Phycisphaerae bacterium]|jgi:hypothetical protein|nr:hypothetical protein [Phycisphaerae bacterium]